MGVGARTWYGASGDRSVPNWSLFRYRASSPDTGDAVPRKTTGNRRARHRGCYGNDAGVRTERDGGSSDAAASVVLDTFDKVLFRRPSTRRRRPGPGLRDGRGSTP